MDKILFIGPTHERSGWGYAARNYVKALNRAGADVVCRPIIFQDNYSPDSEIQELEKKSAIGAKYCVQNILPHMFRYSGQFKKNIGLFFTETKNIGHTSWPSNIKLMDECWVPSFEVVKEIKNYNSNTKLLHVPTDTSVYNKKYEKLDLPFVNGTVFYFIGEFSRRKNLAALLKAFHMAFESTDDVTLLLKLNKPGKSQEELHAMFDEFSTKLKQNLGRFNNMNRYKKEVLIPFTIDDNDMLRLHATCDYFVLTSFGEGWCIPAFDAQAMGNYVISNGGLTGPSEYLTGANSQIINSREENLFGFEKMFSDFGSCRETWNNIDVMQLSYNMNYFHHHKSTIGKARPNIDKFSYEVIGRKMMEYIYA